MTDLISRTAAVECAIDAVDNWDGGWSPNCETVIRKYFEELPSVDAVLVTRCYDCLYFCDMSDMGKGYQCSYHSVMGSDGELENIFYTAPDGYCAWGERRDENA